MEVGYRSSGRAFRAEAQQRMEFFAPVVCKDEQGRLFPGKVIYPLAISVVGSLCAVASLRVTEPLHGGIYNGGEEDRLNVDEHMAKLQSSESTLEILLGIACNGPG